MSDQLVARSLPTHRTTQIRNKRIYKPKVHVLCGIRTHDPSVRANEDSSCLTPRGYCEQHCPPSSAENQECVDIFIRSSVRLHGEETTLILPYLYGKLKNNRRTKYYVSGYYPSFCLCLNIVLFIDWILSPSSGKTYSVEPK
jgi:hypothetical protein